MPLILQNAILTDLDPPRVEHGALKLDGGTIVERGGTFAASPGDETLDCGGCVVLPGLVNGHTHLYSALATGMPPPPRMPMNFLDILQFIWWRLDRALDAESIELSARIGALDALRCGTTTLIDHHASPNCIAGSLDLIERGMATVGLRGVLCYETTDRNGRDGRDAGLAENRRYLAHCAVRRDGRFAGLVGAHASFTLEDNSLAALAEMAEEFRAGVHIHVAEDPCDEQACRRDHGIGLTERLERHGILRRDSIFAHGTHLDAEAVARVNEAGLTMAHNSRSNMNNAVGYAPVAGFTCPVMLGTDGIGGDMFTEVKHAWFKSRDAEYFRAATVRERCIAGEPEPGFKSPQQVLAMLAASARRASAALGVTLGKLEPGAAADILVTDYQPVTPLTSENLAGHFIFGMGPQHVRDVMVGGRWAMRERRALACDEPQCRANTPKVAADLWRRMSKLPA